MLLSLSTFVGAAPFIAENKAYITLLAIIVLVVLFLWNKIPNYIVAFSVVAFLALTGIISVSQLFNGFVNQTTLLILFMGPVGEAIISTGAGEAFGKSLVKISKGREMRLIFFVMMAGIILSAVAPNTAACIALLPITLAIAKKFNISPKKLLMPLAMGTAFGGVLTLIGAAPNVWVNNEATKNGVTPFGFLEFGKVGIFIAIACSIFMILFAKSFNRQIDKEDAKNPEEAKALLNISVNPPPANPSKVKMWISVSILIFTSLVMIFAEPLSDFMGIDKTNLPIMQLAALIGALLTVLTGCMNKKSFLNSISWDSVLLFASLIALGTAMDKSGAAKMVANGFLALFSTASPIILLAAMLLICGTVAQFMSHTAAVGICAPIFISVAQNAGMNAQTVLMGIAMIAGMAVATPIGTPPNVIVANKCNYTFKDFLKTGVPIFAIAWVVSIIFLPIFFPLNNQAMTYSGNNVVASFISDGMQVKDVIDEQGNVLTAADYSIDVIRDEEGNPSASARDSVRAITFNKAYLNNLSGSKQFKIDLDGTDSDPMITIKITGTYSLS